MFNILTHAERSNGGWTVEEFFATGRGEIDAAMWRHDVHLWLAPQSVRALDFGCGIGRDTQALAHWFERVDGVDISEEMIARAREHNDSKAITFHHNPSDDLKLFDAGTFDLVYSMIVLQHMPQALQQGYVIEFFRVLRPGGVAMFEIPDGPDSGHPGWWLSMYGTQRATVEQWIADADAKLVDVEDLGNDAGWQNLRYTAVAA